MLSRNYFSKRRESSESQLIAPINEKKGLKDWMSDEDEDVLLEKATSFDDSDIEVSSKRKRSITLNQKTKRRRFSSLSSKTVTSAPPDYESAKNIGLILVALDPSMAILELVCRSLLGTGEYIYFRSQKYPCLANGCCYTLHQNLTLILSVSKAIWI